jgi:hypothetical protein
VYNAVTHQMNFNITNLDHALSNLLDHELRQRIAQLKKFSHQCR